MTTETARASGRKMSRHRKGLLASSLAAVALACTAGLAGDPAAPAAPHGEVVVLLHGMARTATSMWRMKSALEEAGYRVCNISYPSREYPIAELASEHVAPAIRECVPNPETRVNFVTHSLGGIIVRQLAASGNLEHIGRVVMLGPPNHGSEVVDELGSSYLFELVNGPAGNELGTSDDAFPRQLGPAGFEVGIIAGDRSINWILSRMIPGTDDGKVSVESAKLEGMQDFIVLHASHPFLMMDREVVDQTLHFLDEGSFLHTEPTDAKAE